MNSKKNAQNFIRIGIKKRSMLMRVKSVFFLAVFILCFPLLGIAQGIAVSGKVVDSGNEPLVGVNVSVKGSTIGTSTNSDGQFTLNVPDVNSVLVFEYIGYEKQEQRVGNNRNFQITMNEDVKNLQEVVVVGYGTQKKVNLTGAVGTVSSNVLNTRPAPNTISLLQGRVPGLQIVQNSAMPGSESNQILVRGQGTFSSSASTPLILIDGIEGDLSKLNPNMIESVSVLKDAASSAIYGSRASNGVILVTTKNGKEGRLNVDYSYSYSMQNPTTIQERILNSQEYMEMSNRAAKQSGAATTAFYTDAQIAEWKAGQDPSSPTYNPAQYPNCDWLDYLLRKNAPIQQHFLSVNGGKNGTTYNFGIGMLDQKGMLIATDFRRYDMQMNLKTNLGSRVTFGSNISFSKGKQHDTAIGGGTPLDFNNTEDQLLSAYARSPLQTPKLPDGSGRYTARAYANKGGNKNPIAVAENGGTIWDSYYVLGNAYLKVDIMPGLTAEVKGAAKYNQRIGKALTVTIHAYEFFPDAKGIYQEAAIYNGTANTLTVRNEQDIQYTLYGLLNYTKSFNKMHNLNVMLGYDQESYLYNKLEGYRVGVPGIMWELDATPTAGQVATGLSSEWALKSFFGRLNYDYLGKYLFEANFRYDASSRFPKVNQWALFPSFSAGWRISQEEFLQNDWLSNLKLRASWGQLGNQLPLSPYPYQDALSPTLYNIGGVQQGWYLPKMVNTDIKWETTTATNFGLDFGILNGKLTGSVDWYNKITTGILRSLQVPLHAGLSAPFVNNGELRNRGWEINLGHENKIGDFRYGINVNFDANKNMVLKFGTREIDAGNGYIRQEGLPYNSYYMYIFDGIYQNQDEINALKPMSPLTKPGDMKLKDLNGDNKITPDGDRVPVDGAFPKFNYGFNINAAYKTVDLSMFFQGVQGKKVYVKEWGIAPFRQGSVPSVYWRGAWTPENPNNSIPAVFMDNYAPDTYVNTFYLQDASYLRLKNIQLGYTLPATIIKKIGIQNLRVYASGDNLLTFSNMFQGIDPERVALNSRGVIYPQSKIYSFGVKITF